MRKLSILAFMLATMPVRVTADSPPPTVRSVELSRYLGKWYEIARYPNRFQRDCMGEVTAEYTLRKDGKIAVLNSCRKKNGSLSQARGTAKIADATTNSKLKVTFFWPFYGNYWIVDLPSDYSYAIVGEPQRKYLWILSRTPKMDPVLYESLLLKVEQIGYDPEKLIKTPQSGAS